VDPDVIDEYRDHVVVAADPPFLLVGFQVLVVEIIQHRTYGGPEPFIKSEVGIVVRPHAGRDQLMPETVGQLRVPERDDVDTVKKHLEVRGVTEMDVR
jgi:hypothetical protein